jgi:hypothetical protein
MFICLWVVWLYGEFYYFCQMTAFISNPISVFSELWCLCWAEATRSRNLLSEARIHFCLVTKIVTRVVFVQRRCRKHVSCQTSVDSLNGHAVNGVYSVAPKSIPENQMIFTQRYIQLFLILVL